VDNNEAVENWNNFVESLQAAKNCWEKHTEFMAQLTGSTVEDRKAQILFTRFHPRTKFDVILPVVIGYWRSHGGLSELLIPVKTKKVKMKGGNDE